jgi:hypothetical protein
MIMPTRIGYRQPQYGGQGFARTKKVFGGGAVTLVAADVALNGTVAIARVPKGFVLQSYSLVIGDADTGATLMIQLGDINDVDRIAVAVNTGQAGGTLTTLASTGLLYQYTEDTDILMTASTAAVGLPTTAPTASITMEGYMA